MCGICGVVTAGGRPDLDVVRRMSGRLVHRGPDSDGLHADGPVALAARRLSIIDLEGGSQPIANEDGSVVVVQNGEIYNYRELRRELERAGHRFATASDTEVLVHAYEEHGDGFVERLRGMFAIALWDVALLATAARPRPVRDQAALLPLRRRLALVRLGAEGDARAAGALARDRSPRARRLPRLQLGPGADDDLRRGAQAAGRLHPRLAGRRDRRAALRAVPAGRRGSGTPRARRASSRTSCARPCATRSAPTSSPTSRSGSCSRAASTRPA